MENESGYRPDMEVGAEEEKLETTLKEIKEKLEGEGYVRPGESISIHVYDDPIVRELKPAKSWKGGEWKRVARVDAAVLANPPKELRRESKDDLLYDRLVAASYRVDVYPDFERNTADAYALEYYLYKGV